MRKRRGWMLTVVMNLVVSTITTVMVVVHKATYKGVIAQMLTAIAMLALSEVMKLIVDFDTVHAFLRMPLQTSILCYTNLKDYDHKVGLAMVVISAVIGKIILPLARFGRIIIMQCPIKVMTS